MSELSAFSVDDVKGMVSREQSLSDLERLSTYGPSFTLRINGEVAAVGGFILPWPGLSEIWVVTSPLVEKHPRAFHREAKKVFERMKSLGIRRFQATISQLHPHVYACRRWAESFGFKDDGIARRYGPRGEDHFRVAYVIEG